MDKSTLLQTEQALWQAERIGTSESIESARRLFDDLPLQEIMGPQGRVLAARIEAFSCANQEAATEIQTIFSNWVNAEPGNWQAWKHFAKLNLAIGEALGAQNSGLTALQLFSRFTNAEIVEATLQKIIPNPTQLPQELKLEKAELYRLIAEASLMRAQIYIARNYFTELLQLPATPEQRAVDLFNRANTFSHSGDYEQAVEDLNAAIRRDRTNLLLPFALAETLFIAQQYKETQLALDKVCDTPDSPHYHDALALRAACHTRLKEFEAANSYFSALSSIAPNNVLFYQLRAQHHFAQSDLSKAMRDCLIAEQLSPGDAETIVLMGKIYLATNETNSVKIATRAALEALGGAGLIQRALETDYESRPAANQLLHQYPLSYDQLRIFRECDQLEKQCTAQT